MTGPGQDRQEPVDAFGRPQHPEAPEVPRVLGLAWWLWISATVVGFVRAVVQLMDRGMLISQVSRAAPELSQSEVDAAVNGGIMLTLLVSLGLAAVYVLLANRLLQGRNWARMVVSLVAAFGVLGTVLAMFGMATLGSSVTVQGTTVQLGFLDVVFSLVVAALDAAALALTWHPDSNRYFQRVAAMPRQPRTTRRWG